MIDGLTTITLDSKDQLDAISSAYAELTKSEKEQVSNYDEYIDAKNIYEELVLEDETKDMTKQLIAVGLAEFGKQRQCRLHI